MFVLSRLHKLWHYGEVMSEYLHFSSFVLLSVRGRNDVTIMARVRGGRPRSRGSFTGRGKNFISGKLRDRSGAYSERDRGHFPQG